MSRVTINQLTAVDSVASGDQLPIYQAQNSDARKASINKVQEYMQANLDFAVDAVIKSTTQTEQVLAGFSLQVTSGDDNIFLIMVGVGTLATGTIILPFKSNIIDKQEILVFSIPAVTTLTLDENGATAIVGAPSALTANSFFKLRYDITSDVWYRVG